MGAGPGDPGLLTLRAKECIELADVLVYDYLANPDFLLWAKPDCEKIYAGKKAGDHALKQEETNALLIRLAREGKTVTRLKGGDVFVFGRGGEEAEELVEAGVPFEIVPGISSTIAGPAYAGIPVTHRAHNTQLTIFTGHEDPTKETSSLDFDALAAAPGTKVMLMGIERLRALTGEFLQRGTDPSTPIALVRWATTPRQQTLTGTLGDIADKAEAAGFKAPAVAVWGGVVGLRDKLNWFEKRPLFGRRVVVTRTRQQAGALTSRLRALGADVIEIPTIRIDPAPDLREFAEQVRDAHTYEWIIFTSPNGVEKFFELFYKMYQDARSIGGCRIAAIGPGTAAKLKEFHMATDFLPKTSEAEAFVTEFLVQENMENRTVLVVRPEVARDVVSEKLIEAGAIVDEGIAYRTVPETSDETGAQARFRDEGADILTFASSSAVEAFLALKLPMPEGVKIASIGPITSATLKKHGLPIHAEAATHDIPGLALAVVKLAQG